MTTPHRRFTRRTVLKGSVAALPVAAGIAGTSSAQEPGASPAATPPPAQDPIPELVAGNTAFALDLYAALRAELDGNLLFSPYSISQALAMTYAGANGETAAQMAQTLSFRLDQPALPAAFHDLNADLEARANAAPGRSGDAPGLRLANALWGEQTTPFRDAFAAQLEQEYGAGLRRVDFRGAPGAARDEINAWVADQTENRIRDIVPEGAITAMTRLVLANAIYFYGAWLNPFDPGATKDDVFHLLDGTTVTVPFMAQHEHLDYARGDGFVAIELPYGGDSGRSGFALTVIVPDAGRFDAVEAKLDAGALDAALAGLASTDVRVWLPRFEFEVAASLGETLRAMGMVDAFDPGRADFSRMVEGTEAPIVIDEVLHKAFISVDENGTEAAAATVVIGVGAGAPEPGEPVEVRVDRPFLFAIRDTQTGTLLFLGRVLNPKP